MGPIWFFHLYKALDQHIPADMHTGADGTTERGIIHLDMDCFFASVASLAEPSFQGKPLAVSHSNSAQGTGEISSANYEARKFGIRASMFIAEAKKRCPHLIVMPYQFDKYEEVSEQVTVFVHRVRYITYMTLG